MRLSLLALVCLAAASAETRYEIDLAKAPSHRLAVTAEADCAKADCDFQLPVWNATYQVREFAQYVSGFEAARSNGEALPHRMLTPSSWRVTAAPGERVRVRYQYYADLPSPFGCSASSRHVFLNFAEILVYPVGRQREPMSVTFRSKPQGWKVALELAERGGTFGGQSFHARNYDELVDAPVEISAFAEATFSLAGKRLRVVMDGDPEDYDLGRIERAARQVAETAIEIMQGAPFSSYTFIYHFRRNGGGGMEHANSTAIDARAPCRDCDLAGVTAHEFFHLWNVKRIRPQSLEPVDYTRENITPSLWFAEGVTSTYASYILLQASLEDSPTFLRRLGGDITRYERTPARLTQSAEESSIDTWLDRYPYYGRPARSVSYYLKGELAGYLLDLAIRHHSGNRRSLDDMMRRLNTEYAQQGRYFEDTDALERVASEVAGHSMKEFFDSVIRRAAPIEWDRFLGYAGHRLATESVTAPTLGIETHRPPGTSVTVGGVEPDGPGDRAGVQAGDKLLSLNHRALRGPFEEALAALNLKPGARVTVEVERGDQTLSLEVHLEFIRRTSYRVEAVPRAGAEQKAIGAAWLRSAAVSTKP